MQIEFTRQSGLGSPMGRGGQAFVVLGPRWWWVLTLVSRPSTEVYPVVLCATAQSERRRGRAAFVLPPWAFLFGRCAPRTDRAPTCLSGGGRGRNDIGATHVEPLGSNADVFVPCVCARCSINCLLVAGGLQACVWRQYNYKVGPYLGPVSAFTALTLLPGRPCGTGSGRARSLPLCS